MIEKLREAMRSKKTHKAVIERNLLLIELACKAGLRRGELSNLLVKDIDFLRNYLIVRQGKGKKDRIIDLTPTLREMLQLYLKGKLPNESVFNLSPNTISGIIRWAAKKAGIDVHTHSLRHFFGQSLVDSGTDLETVRRLMGHRNLKTTQIYIGRTDIHRREAINRLEGNCVSDKVQEDERVTSTGESESKLHLKVRQVAVNGSSKGVYLVLLRLIFVNLGSVGMTVYHLGLGAPDTQHVSKPGYESYDEDEMVSIYMTSNDAMIVDIKKSELLWLPLDIPPHESRSKWVALQIRHDFSSSGIPQVPLVIIAEDIAGEIIAEYREPVELRTYTIP